MGNQRTECRGIERSVNRRQIKHDQLRKLKKARKHSAATPAKKEEEKKEEIIEKIKDHKTENECQQNGHSNNVKMKNINYQNMNPYYYATPVIVTGPSNDIHFDFNSIPNEHGVIYDQSPIKRIMNEEVESDEEYDNMQTMDSSEDVIESDLESNGESETTELMQYEDDIDNIQESEDAIFDINESLKERAQSEHEQDIENGQIGPRHIRSKSVPATPNFSELEKSPFDNVQSLSLNESEQKKPRTRSSSMDNMDPLQHPTEVQKLAPMPEKKKKSKKKKNKKKHKKHQSLTLEDEITMKSNHKKRRLFTRKKSHQKHMENYANLHKNINEYDEALKPAMVSNVQYMHSPKMKKKNKVKEKTNNHKIKMNEYQFQTAHRQRMEMQNFIAQSDHILVNPYRQFSVCFNERPFRIKLQFRNGFNAFMRPPVNYIQHSQTLTRSEYIWGWFVVNKHQKYYIPIGSKLISINFQWIYGKNQEEISQLMYNSPLPTTLIFEAPSYLNHVPPSIHIEVNDENSTQETDEKYIYLAYLQKYKNIIFWWLEQGGLISIILIILSFNFYIYLAFLLVFILNMPPKELLNVFMNFLNFMLFKVPRRRQSGLTLFGRNIFGENTNYKSVTFDNRYVSISEQNSLLKPNQNKNNNLLPTSNQMASRRSYQEMNHRKKKKQKKQQKIFEEDNIYEINVDEIKEEIKENANTQNVVKVE